jgi:hypothetical protein
MPVAMHVPGSDRISPLQPANRHEGAWRAPVYRAAAFSPSQPTVKSAICRLFLSIISMF